MVEELQTRIEVVDDDCKVVLGKERGDLNSLGENVAIWSEWVGKIMGSVIWPLQWGTCRGEGMRMSLLLLLQRLQDELASVTRSRDGVVARNEELTRESEKQAGLLRE